MPIKPASLKSATNYLELRNFKILELGIKSKIVKVDILAKKNNLLYFILIEYDNNLPINMKSSSEINKLISLAEDYLKQTKINIKYNFSSITLDNQTNTVLEFIDNLNY